MLGQPNYRPHLVEFIRGTGVRVDGVVVQDVGGNGPFTFALPDDVSLLTSLDLIGNGLGGSGGGNVASPLSLGGGAGGLSGRHLAYRDVAVLPGSSLVVTIPGVGAGGAVNSSSGGGGEAATISGLLGGYSFGLNGTLTTNTSGMYVTDAGESASAIDVTGGQGTAAGQDADNQLYASSNAHIALNGYVQQWNGAAGGGGKAAGAVGGSGGGVYFSYLGMDSLAARAAGTNSGGVSRGGGGQGAFSQFGRGGYGGSGAVGGDAPVANYGAGGGGGAGGFAGGASAPGYCRLTYWSAR